MDFGLDGRKPSATLRAWSSAVGTLPLQGHDTCGTAWRGVLCTALSTAGACGVDRWPSSCGCVSGRRAPIAAHRMASTRASKTGLQCKCVCVGGGGLMRKAHGMQASCRQPELAAVASILQCTAGQPGMHACMRGGDIDGLACTPLPRPSLPPGGILHPAGVEGSHACMHAREAYGALSPRRVSSSSVRDSNSYATTPNENTAVHTEHTVHAVQGLAQSHSHGVHYYGKAASL